MPMGLFSAEARQRREERLARMQERAAAAQFKNDLRHFRGLKVSDDTIAYHGQGGPLAGARASVETAGDVERRITATRLVATGPLALAWRKKRDHRELYLAVEGDGYAFVVPVDPDRGLTARQVAARINTLASR